MRILYITPKANDFGGVAKILSVKANELSKNHKVHIATQNNGWQNSPHKFDQNITFYDMLLHGNKLFFLFRYRKAIRKICKEVKPEIIFVSDNGLKAYILPLLLTSKCPVVFEVRGSLYNQMQKVSDTKVMTFFLKIKYFYRKTLVQLYDYIVFLSKESQDEWKINKNTFIIPNPLHHISDTTANLENKTALCVARNSHEKGLDRLLEIWQLVQTKHKDWILKIVGIDLNDDEILKKAIHLRIEKSVQIMPPTTEITNEYLSASMYLLPSRSEGFPNVLLEAQSCGLPIVAYNAPIGAKAIVKDYVNGFLIKDGDAVAFAEKLELLFTDKKLRLKMGELGRENSLNYSKEKIISKWESLIEKVVKKS